GCPQELPVMIGLSQLCGPASPTLNRDAGHPVRMSARIESRGAGAIPRVTGFGALRPKADEAPYGRRCPYPVIGSADRSSGNIGAKRSFTHPLITIRFPYSP